jgi:hypothetical protein
VQFTEAASETTRPTNLTKNNKMDRTTTRKYLCNSLQTNK